MEVGVRLVLGLMDGDVDGFVLGAYEGLDESVGLIDGTSEATGLCDDNDVGLAVGKIDGLLESVGSIEGISDGAALKADEGCEVANDIGDVVGLSVGATVGENVGKTSSNVLGGLMYETTPLLRENARGRKQAI